MECNKKKMLSLGILLIFLMIWVPPIITNSESNDQNSEIDRITEYNNIRSSAFNSINEVRVNGTSLYEDGTYYCFRGDSLSFVVAVTTDVSSLTLTLLHPTTPANNFAPLSFTKSGGNFIATLTIPVAKAVAKYGGTFTIGNTTGATSTFRFNVSVNDPNPKILKAQVSDTKFLASPYTKELIEGETYTTYQSALIGFDIWVENRDGLANLNLPKLVYENGMKTLWAERSFNYVEDTNIYGRAVRRYTLNGLINISLGSSSFDAKINWSSDYYIFKIVSEDTGNKKFTFEFNVYVSNCPPMITQLTGTGDIDNAGAKAKNEHSFLINVNATDYESDMLFKDNVYNFSYTALPTAAEVVSPFVFRWPNAPHNQTISRVLALDSEAHEVNVTSGAVGGYFMNFTFAKDYCFEDNNICPYFNLSYYVNASTSLTLTVAVYDYSTSSWVNVGTFSTGTGDIVNPRSILISTTSLKNYIRYSQFNRLQTRIRANTDGTLNINFAKVEFKMLRKATFSNLMVDVYRPNDILPSESIDINNMYAMDYDGGANRWSLNYTVAINKSNFGLYKFVVRPLDWGSKNAIDLDTTQVGHGVNKISMISFNPTDKSRSYAMKTITFRYGISSTDALALNSISVNSSKANNADTQVTLTLTDYDAPNVKNTIDVPISPSYSEIGLFTGEFWNEDGFNITTKKYIPYKHGIYGNATLTNLIMNKTDLPSSLSELGGMAELNDGEYFRFRTNPYPVMQPDSAYIVPFYLDAKSWLNKYNVTDIKVEINHWFNQSGNDPWVSYMVVQFWDYKNFMWVTPNEATYPLDLWRQDANTCLVKSDTSENRTIPWLSTSWNASMPQNLETMRNCIDEKNKNQMLLRVLIHGSDFQQPHGLNMSIDYLKLHVKYNNSYTAQVNCYAMDGSFIQTYNMTMGSHSGTTRIYQATIPTKSFTISNVMFDFFAQNGNHTLRVLGGQRVGQRSFLTNEIESVPYYNESMLASDPMKNYIVKVMPQYAQFTPINNVSILNFHRWQEDFMFNGSIVYPKNITSLIRISVQLRQADMESSSEWINIDGVESSSTDFPLRFNSTTNEWNIKMTFKNNFEGTVWRSGLWYYRILVVDGGHTYSSTVWQEFRLHNYQPRNFEIHNLQSGNYYRVTDNVNYKIYFQDYDANNDYIEADGSEFNVSVFMNVYDRYEAQDITWDSNTYARYDRVEKVQPDQHRFPFIGFFNFSKNVNIGTYNNIVFQVADNDIDWPQVGTLELHDYWFTVLNHAPTIKNVLATNTSNNEVYRDNWVKVSTTISDIDDYFNHINPTTWTLSWINSTGGYNIRNVSAECVRSNSSGNARFDFEFFVDIRNKTGDWPMVANFRDWDGATLTSNQQLSVKIKNNLPVLKNLFLEDLDTGAVAYFGNQTDFGIYRNDHTVRITAEVYDVEDSRIEELDYSISGIKFDLVNTFKPGVYTSPTFVFSQKMNGSLGYYLEGTWDDYTYSPNKYNLVNTNQLLPENESNIIIQGESDITRIKSDDLLTHDILFIKSPGLYGGEYIVDMDPLPLSYARHEIGSVVNITIKYKTNGTSVLYLLNRTSGEYVEMQTLSSSAWATINIPLTRSQLDHFITDGGQDVLQVRIISTGPNHNRLEIDMIRLNYRQQVNRKYEVWEAEFKVPNTAQFKAGDLKIRLSMTDQDGGVGTNQLHTLNVLNHAPVFLGDKFWIEIGDMKINIVDGGVQKSYSLEKGYPYIDFYVNAKDIDGAELGITTITIHGKILYQGLMVPNSWSMSFEAKAHLNDSSNPHLFLMKVDMDPKMNPEFNGVTRLVVESVEISDADLGYADISRFECSSILTNLKISIEFTGSSGAGSDFPWWIIVLIVGGVAAVSFGIWFYRTKISWRKYLSKDDD